MVNGPSNTRLEELNRERDFWNCVLPRTAEFFFFFFFKGEHPLSLLCLEVKNLFLFPAWSFRGIAVPKDTKETYHPSWAWSSPIQIGLSDCVSRLATGHGIYIPHGIRARALVIESETVKDLVVHPSKHWMSLSSPPH